MAIHLIAFVLIVVLYIVFQWFRRSPSSEDVIRVRELFIYPIKSCGGICVKSAKFDRFGFGFDRRWFISSAAPMSQISVRALIQSRENKVPDGFKINEGDRLFTFRSQREYPKMALIEPSIVDDYLIVKAPNMKALRIPMLPPKYQQERVVVWKAVMNAHRYLDASIDEWFSKFLGVPCSLFTMTEDHGRYLSPKYGGASSITAVFSDGFPFLISNNNSLADLNKNIPRRFFQPICVASMKNFRPNIVVDANLRTLPAWDEDYWKKICIFNKDEGEKKFIIAKPCSRCTIPIVDADRGVRHPSGEPIETLRKLRTFRLSEDETEEIYFAQNAIQMDESGKISVGDIVSIIERNEKGCFLSK